MCRGNWIKLIDRKPPIKVNVNVRCSTGIFEDSGVVGSNYGTDWMRSDGIWDFCNNVTHWQPIVQLEEDILQE